MSSVQCTLNVQTRALTTPPCKHKRLNNNDFFRSKGCIIHCETRAALFLRAGEVFRALKFYVLITTQQEIPIKVRTFRIAGIPPLPVANHFLPCTWGEDEDGVIIEGSLRFPRPPFFSIPAPQGSPSCPPTGSWLCELLIDKFTSNGWIDHTVRGCKICFYITQIKHLFHIRQNITTNQSKLQPLFYNFNSFLSTHSAIFNLTEKLFDVFTFFSLRKQKIMQVANSSLTSTSLEWSCSNFKTKVSKDIVSLFILSLLMPACGTIWYV